MSDTNNRKKHKCCQKSLSFIDTVRCKICPHVPAPPPNPPPRWPRIEPLSEEEKEEIKQSFIDSIRSKFCPPDPTICGQIANSSKKTKKPKPKEYVPPPVKNPEPLAKPTEPETPSPKASKSCKKKCDSLYTYDPCGKKSHCILYPPCKSPKSPNEECKPPKKEPEQGKNARGRSKSMSELYANKCESINEQKKLEKDQPDSCDKEQPGSREQKQPEICKQEHSESRKQKQPESCEQEQPERCEQQQQPESCEQEILDKQVDDKKPEPIKEKTEEKEQKKESVACKPDKKQSLVDTLRSKLCTKLCPNCPSNVQIECPPKEPEICEPPPQPEPELKPEPEPAPEPKPEPVPEKPKIICKRKIPESERKPCIPGTPVMDILKAKMFPEPLTPSKYAPTKKAICPPTCEDGPSIPCPDRGQGLQSEALDEFSKRMLNSHQRVMGALSCAANDLMENIKDPEIINKARERADCVVSELREKAKKLNPANAEEVPKCKKHKTKRLCDSFGSSLNKKEEQNSPTPPPNRNKYCAKDTVIYKDEDYDARNKRDSFGSQKSSKHNVPYPKQCCDRPSTPRSLTKLVSEEVVLTIADDAPTTTTLTDVVSSIKGKFCALFFDTNDKSLSDSDYQTAANDDSE